MARCFVKPRDKFTFILHPLHYLSDIILEDSLFSPILMHLLILTTLILEWYFIDCFVIMHNSWSVNLLQI